MRLYNSSRAAAFAVGATLLGIVATVSPASAQVQVYFNNFDGTETFGAGITGGLSGITTTEAVQGFAGLGPVGNQFSGNFLRNQTAGNPASLTTLTLNNLPAHTSVDIDFLLAVIDSWDGVQAPDIFNVRVNNTVIFNPSFAIASGSSNYTPPAGGDIGGGATQRGFNGGWNDLAYNMYLEPLLGSVPHTASTLTIDIFASGGGWQGGIDESWAVDNLRVTLGGVTATAAPEAHTAAFVATGLLPLLGVALRRRRGKV
jgi:hypothetical protein